MTRHINTVPTDDGGCEINFGAGTIVTLTAEEMYELNRQLCAVFMAQLSV